VTHKEANRQRDLAKFVYNLEFVGSLEMCEPFDSYELTIHTEDGEPLPTASALQKTMVETNDRLAGKFRRMWKVSLKTKKILRLSIYACRRFLFRQEALTNLLTIRWTPPRQSYPLSVWIYILRVLRHLEI